MVSGGAWEREKEDLRSLTNGYKLKNIREKKAVVQERKCRCRTVGVSKKRVSWFPMDKKKIPTLANQQMHSLLPPLVYGAPPTTWGEILTRQVPSEKREYMY